MADTKMVFRNEIKRLSELGVIKQVKNKKTNYISCLFLQEETNFKHKLLLMFFFFLYIYFIDIFFINILKWVLSAML